MRRRRGQATIGILALLLLGACADADGRRAGPIPASATGTDGAVPTNAAAILWHGAGPGGADFDAGRLVGLDGTALERLLGEPALVRRDAPAEVWQYRSADCVLDLFLYEAGGEGAERPRVLYVEARSGAAEPASAGPCIGSLMGLRRDLRTS